jgi:NADH:ubiquinone oxidoreductase subunit 6 (subunit J)
MFLGKTKRSAARPNRGLLGIALVTVVAIGVFLFRLVDGAGGKFPEVAADYGTIERVSELLLGNYIFPFELTGLLLTVAVIGAVLLARREAPGSRGALPTAKIKVGPDAASTGGGNDA